MSKAVTRKELIGWALGLATLVATATGLYGCNLKEQARAIAKEEVQESSAVLGELEKMKRDAEAVVKEINDLRGKAGARWLWGRVDAEGNAVGSHAEWSVSGADGKYTIKFTTPFTKPPTVLMLPESNSDDFFGVRSVSESQVDIEVQDYTSPESNPEFHKSAFAFLVVGN